MKRDVLDFGFDGAKEPVDAAVIPDPVKLSDTGVPEHFKVKITTTKVPTSRCSTAHDSRNREQGGVVNCRARLERGHHRSYKRVPGYST